MQCYFRERSLLVLAPYLEQPHSQNPHFQKIVLKIYYQLNAFLDLQTTPGRTLLGSMILLLLTNVRHVRGVQMEELWSSKLD